MKHPFEIGDKVCVPTKKTVDNNLSLYTYAQVMAACPSAFKKKFWTIYDIAADFRIAEFKEIGGYCWLLSDLVPFVEEPTTAVRNSFIIDVHSKSCKKLREKLEKEFPELFPKPKPTYKPGDRFKMALTTDPSAFVCGCTYMLVRFGYNKVVLVNAEDGNLWYDVEDFTAEDAYHITEEELFIIAGSDFKPVKVN
jgi:hypothetical protein